MSKVIFITGASSGIGKTIGEHLINQNFKVYGTSRNPKHYPDSKIKLLQLDVRNPEEIKSSIEKVVALEGRIDVLINNAGVGITGPLEEIPISEIKNNFDVNLFGPIEMMQSVLPFMRTQNSGLIINITSIAGYMGLPFRSVYSASKGALELITEGVRMEVKPFNIQIVNVAPGDFATNIASGRFHAPLLAHSAYNKTYGQTLETMNQHVDTGNNPMEMAKFIEKVIQTQNPKIHYKVGAFLQKFSIVLKRLMSDKQYESMLMKHYKL
jgi:NAD(P)-dependent dehydrogenase (short-subunit alcohol dehydrogenase family)